MENYELLLLAPLVVCVIFLAIYSYYSFRLYYYLMNNKYDKWEELTTIEGFGSGFLNPGKWKDYQFTIYSEDDAMIQLFKTRLKMCLILSGVCFGIFICFILVVATVLSG